MAYATLVVHAEANDDAKGRIALAAELARQAGAMLVGIAARDLVPPVSAPVAGPVVITALLNTQEEEIKADLAAAEQQFRAVLDKQDQPIAWRSVIGDPAEVLAHEGRVADLIVVGRRPEGMSASRTRHPDPGNVLMRAGRPVLLVPPGLSHLDTTTIIVAWKDSREARRAVTDALPLLARAANVQVIEICHSAIEQKEARTGVEDVAAFLVRHGCAATAEARLLREASVSAELLLVAEQHGAGLIVAGGYGHSRLQEWAFGGLTRTLLHHAPKCCLLSH